MFYGMEPDQLSKSSYAQMKQDRPKISAQLPSKVKSSAFRIDTGLKRDPEFQKHEKAFFLQSEPGSRRSQVNSREERLRNSRLANAGGLLMQRSTNETDSQRFRKAEKAFYLLPSSHASHHGSRPMSNHGNVPTNQNEHLREITGGNSGAVTYKPYGEPQGQAPTRKIDSSASLRAAKKAFYCLDSQVRLYLSNF